MQTKLSLFLSVVLCFLYFGCSSTPGSLPPFDPTLSDDQTCTLQIDTRLLVKQFDGQKVNWSAGFWQGYEKGITSIKIPIDSHSFLIDFEWNFSGSSNYYSKKDIGFSFNDFKAGGIYLMKPLTSGSYNALISNSIEFGGITIQEVTNNTTTQ
jgi:hypothetical protein